MHARGGPPRSATSLISAMIAGHSSRGRSCPMPGKVTSLAPGGRGLPSPDGPHQLVSLAVQDEGGHPHACQRWAAIAAGQDCAFCRWRPAGSMPPRSYILRPTSRSHSSSSG